MKRRITSLHEKPHTGQHGKIWWRVVHGNSTMQYVSRPTNYPKTAYLFFSRIPDRWFEYVSRERMYLYKVTAQDGVRYYFAAYETAHVFSRMIGGLIHMMHPGIKL